MTTLTVKTTYAVADYEGRFYRLVNHLGYRVDWTWQLDEATVYHSEKEARLIAGTCHGCTRIVKVTATNVLEEVE